MMKKDIIIFDYDGTLTENSFTPLDLLVEHGYMNESGARFQDELKKRTAENGGDPYTAYFAILFDAIREIGLPLTDETMKKHSIERLNRKVPEFLDMLNEEGVENYMLSSNIQVYLENSIIANRFKKIFGATFSYSEDGSITSVEKMVTDAVKVDIIKSILEEKGIGSEDTSRVIYIGDGLTDLPAMRYVKEHGGVCIYLLENDKIDVEEIKESGVVDYFALKDFSEKSELYRIVRLECQIQKKEMN